MSRPPGRVSGLVPLAAAFLTTAAVVVWLLMRDSTRGLPLAGYAASPVALLAAAAACQRIGSQIVVARPVRGFWKRMSHAAISLALAGVVAGVTAQPTPGVSPYAVAPVVLGVALAMLAFLHLPLGRRTALNWLQTLLDIGTVALAAMLFYAFLAFDLAVPGTSGRTAAAAAVMGVSGVIAVAVVGKAAVTPGGVVDSAALRILTLAPLSGSAGAALLITTDGAGRVALTVLTLPVVGLVICLAAYRQLQVLRREPRARRRRRVRSAFNFLPFLAVAVTAGLVLVVSAQELAWRHRLVVIGALLIAGLVALRQVTGLRENRLLLRENRRRQRELEQVAMRDPLTGLANRAEFGSRLGQRLATHQPAAVLLIDIDDFKMVNDSMGHAVGDQLLHEVAQRLRRYSRADRDLPARLGGDEFAVLLDMDDADYAEAAAARVLEALAAPFAVGDDQLLVHASVGVALAGAGDSADEVLRNADIAMYAAKAGGKASWTRYEPRMRREVVNTARLGSELHNALVRNELFLLFQPVFDLGSGRIAGAEALVRWQHPTRGFVPPSDFIPVAERTGLIVPLGSWVLRAACEQLARWRAQMGGAAIRTVNVNVAARQLRDEGFVGEVTRVLADTGLSPANLVIEVTETMVLDGRQERATLQALHEMGVRLALDDFGTGQSSLSLLRAFPVDVLKLDKSFVDGLDEGGDRGRLAVAAAVAQLAEHLTLSAVAEGIETEEQMDRLRIMGYRLGQGFHLARPLPADEVAALMTPVVVQV